MDARRARILAGSAFVVSLVAAMSAGPAAAAGCALSAPAYANVGTPLTIEGSGFPASTPVDVDFTVGGTPADATTIQSDANGALQIALTPEDLDIGVTTVSATAGSACTAQVTYTVLAAGEAPPATPEPEAPGPVTGPAAPQTDTESPPGGSSSATWLMALALMIIGGAGWVLTRPARQR